MSALTSAPLHGARFHALLTDAPALAPSLDDEQRRALADRVRSLAGSEPRRLDAWSVERVEAPRSFRWSAMNARRTLGNAALRRVASQHSSSVLEAVTDVVTDRLLAAAAGFARPGSLGHWLAQLDDPARAIVVAEATNWATTLVELSHDLDVAWRPAASDAYYALAGARVTLRAQREFLIDGSTRIVVRVRSGSPGRSAGAGLRAELAVETLAHPHGDAPGRYVGIWPDAGLALAVEGTLEDVRTGARHLLRAARRASADGLSRAA
ncbi:MAG TPA: hypothetical protein VLS91_03775 [Acidimicrobiales bacterium]|nr:hypothetical protein [Acidimicrobiales bacterium]